MNKAIIYCRKSTDRSDRQQLSVENQVEEALKVAKREGLDVIEIIKESKSAKDPGRPEFNRMMSLINKGKADCIITWKLNRLARNPIDEGSIKWALQSGVIKCIFTQGEVFRTGDNVLIMGMHFGMSTQYILDLKADSARGVKKKMKEGGVCHKAPIGYLNDKTTKTIYIDPVKSKWVKEMFELRASRYSYKEISNILYKKGVRRNNGTKIPPTSIDTLLRNKFYIGIVRRAGEEYQGNYERFISNNLFEKAQKVGKGFHYRTGEKACYFKGFIKDKNGLALSGYKTRGHIYYKCSTASSETINISQKKIFQHFEEEFKEFKMKRGLLELNKKIVLEVVKQRKPEIKKSLERINFQIRKLEERQKELLNLRLDGELEKEIYLERKNDFVRQIQELEEDKYNLKNDNLEEKIKQIVELPDILYQSYKSKDLEEKSVFLKKLIVELFIKNKKELSYAENSLYSGLKMLQKYDFSNLEVPPGVEPGYRALQAPA